ncbi:hypothetical protein DPSP01_013049 [Paraphaeosphaeria sporulosa]
MAMATKIVHDRRNGIRRSLRDPQRGSSSPAASGDPLEVTGTTFSQIAGLVLGWVGNHDRRSSYETTIFIPKKNCSPFIIDGSRANTIPKSPTLPPLPSVHGVDVPIYEKAEYTIAICSIQKFGDTRPHGSVCDKTQSIVRPPSMSLEVFL